MNFTVGDVVESLNGRDRGRVFAVVKVDETGVYIADGRKRKLNKPKRKQYKHIKAIEGLKVRITTNKALWRSLEVGRSRADNTDAKEVT